MIIGPLPLSVARVPSHGVDENVLLPRMQGEFLRKNFGIKADLFGALPGRQTFVIDKSGVCRLSFNNQFQPEKHIQEALDVIKTL